MHHHNTPKVGTKETVKRHDNRFAVYQYMVDPTLTKEELEHFQRIDYLPGRWVQVDVLEQHQ